MTKNWTHKVKPIPSAAASGVPVLPAPPTLGRPRFVPFTRDDWRDVAYVGTLWNSDPLSPGFGSPAITMQLAATRLSWPRDGGRAIVVINPAVYGFSRALEIWTETDLAEVLGHYLPTTTALAGAQRVWRDPIRADPADWPRGPARPYGFQIK